MPSNVEIKARLFDREKAICVAGQLSGSEGELLEQDDTFFSVAQGRLKLRVQSTSGHAVAMLIQYHRPDKEGPKLSDYTIATTQTPEELKTILTQCLGELGTVRKQRRLFVVGQTRIHIDTVVLRPGQLPSEGESIANDLMGQLGVTPDNLVSGAYVDLLYKQHTALGHPT
jgi:adenylate cyclase class IV